MTQPIRQLLTPAEIEEFRRIVKARCGVELSADDTVTVVEQLLRVLKVVRDVVLKKEDDN